MAPGLKGYDPSKFKAGSEVCVVSRAALDGCLATWKLRHELQPDQQACAGQTARVVRPEMYRGGDRLYELEGISGTWHEQCLEAV